MKKITAFFMALTMCAYLAACGGTNEETTVPQTETETQQSTDAQTETETQQTTAGESTAEEPQSQPAKETQPEASEGTTQAASEEESAACYTQLDDLYHTPDNPPRQHGDDQTPVQRTDTLPF